MAVERNLTEKKLRIALVFPSLRTGLLYHRAMLEALRRQGFVVDVFTGLAPAVGSSDMQIFSARDLHRKVPDDYAKGAWIVSPRLVVQLTRSRPHVILAVEYSMATVWSMVAARFAGSQFVIFQEHANRDRVSVLRRVYRRFLARRADFVVANTTAAKSELTEIIGIDSSTVVEVPWLSPPPRESLLQGRPPNLPTLARPCFLFVGDLSGRKNVVALVEAAGLLRSRGLDFSLLIAGEGEQREPLRRQVRRFGLDSDVTFLGSIPYEEVGHLYDTCDVFIMPSLVDYRSVSVLEAMRFGKALLVSSQDGNAGDTARDGQNAFVFNPRNPSQLADLMERFVKDASLADLMGNKSMDIISDQTPARAASLLRKAVERGARSRGRNPTFP